MANEKTIKRTGLDKSIYLSKRANEILFDLEGKTQRSRSKLISLIVEKYGPGLLKGRKGFVI